MNEARSVLEETVYEEHLICMNDLLPTYRSPHSVIETCFLFDLM